MYPNNVSIVMKKRLVFNVVCHFTMFTLSPPEMTARLNHNKPEKLGVLLITRNNNDAVKRPSLVKRNLHLFPQHTPLDLHFNITFSEENESFKNFSKCYMALVRYQWGVLQ